MENQRSSDKSKKCCCPKVAQAQKRAPLGLVPLALTSHTCRLKQPHSLYPTNGDERPYPHDSSHQTRRRSDMGHPRPKTHPSHQNSRGEGSAMRENNFSPLCRSAKKNTLTATTSNNNDNNTNIGTLEPCPPTWRTRLNFQHTCTERTPTGPAGG